jgi:alpha-beta hydrolase superfamily lysophospholipase
MMACKIDPLSTSTLISRPNADQSRSAGYQDALERFRVLSEAEAKAGPLLDVCRSKLLTHGQATEHVLVLFHGYTNCPEQFRQLGERFHELGYNVFIPRLPYHGYADRLTGDIARLTAEDLVAYGDRAVDIARGLARRVTVMGLSAGGVVAAWLAQNRADVEYAAPIAASLGVSFVPALWIRPLTGALLALPNFYIWWDPRTKEKNPFSVYHAYPRYASRSLGHILRLGIALKVQARRAGPAGHSVLMITNAAEPAVDNGMIDQLVKSWRQHGARVRTYSFEQAMNLPHDLITPGTPGVPTEEVYARLIEQIQALHMDDSAGQKAKGDGER